MNKPRRFRFAVVLTVSGHCKACNIPMVTAYKKTHAEMRCPQCGEFRGVLVTTTSAPTMWGILHDHL